jgi:retron-type reverse transcriptase
VIEPLVEANFHETSSGVRPKRSATPAVKVVNEQLRANGYGVEVASARFVDPIDPERLRRLVARRIRDRRV